MVVDIDETITYTISHRYFLKQESCCLHHSFMYWLLLYYSSGNTCIWMDDKDRTILPHIYILTIDYHILAIKVVVQFVVCCVSSLVSTYVDTYYHCYSIVYFFHVYSSHTLHVCWVDRWCTWGKVTCLGCNLINVHWKKKYIPILLSTTGSGNYVIVFGSPQ